MVTGYHVTMSFDVTVVLAFFVDCYFNFVLSTCDVLHLFILSLTSLFVLARDFVTSILHVLGSFQTVICCELVKGLGRNVALYNFLNNTNL